VVVTVRQNIKFIVDDIHPTATLTATSEALDIENTQNALRAYVWRSADLEPQIITGTLAAPIFASGLAISRHNLTGGGEISIVLKLDGDTVFDSVIGLGGVSSVGGFIPAGVWQAGIDPWGATYNQSLGVMVTDIWFGRDYLFDSYEITINDPDNPDGYIQVCQVVLGRATTFDPGFELGSLIRWVENVKHSRTDGETLRSEGTGQRHRVMELDLGLLADSDRVAMVTTMGRAGQKQPIYVSMYPDAGGMLEVEHAMVAKRVSNLEFNHQHPAYWQNKLILEEV
jgi:hypothetical protein